MIEFRNIRKEYQDVTPIENLSAVIRDGEIVSIIGPSGTGKSTLLRMVNMLTEPSSGQIFVDGEEITAKNYPLNKLRQKAVMVFQNFNLFSNLTVIENVTEAPIRLKGIKPSEAYDKGMELLKKVGLAREALKYPDELSSGQKQRVAIARTLAMDPEIILFDEPTSALDPTMVGEVEKAIQGLCGKGYTILLVTHDMKFAEKVSTRIIFLCNGGVCEDGSPEEIFHNPKKQETIEFVKQSKEFNCVVTEEDDDSEFLEFYTQIDRFAFRNGLGQKTKERVITLFEEIVFQILIPENKKRAKEGTGSGKYEIPFHVSYSTRGAGTMVDIETGELDINMERDYPLSYRLIEFCSESFAFEEDGSGKKKIVIKVKEENR